MIRAWSSTRWPSSEATVTVSTIYEREGSRRAGFEPTIENRYVFQGVEYVGHRIRFGGVSTRNRQEAEQVSWRFSTGTRWVVSVCERRPSLSVLHPGVGGHLWFGVFFFSVYIAIAISFLVDAVKEWP